MTQRRSKYFFKRYPKTTLFFLLLLFLLVTELVFRQVWTNMGYSIGNFAPYWEHYQPTDSLVCDAYFRTDYAGVYKAIPNKFSDVNDLGFRGRVLKFDSTDKLKILHIGDSFTWGASASSYSKSFAGLFDQNDQYWCYNTGIPGADPAQYYQIVFQYVPIVLPDVVMVHVYLGNDIMTEYRELRSFQPLFYQTNIGWLPGYSNGAYFNSCQESYQYYEQMYKPKGQFQHIISKTAIGTALLSLPLRMQEHREWEKNKKSEVTAWYLNEIANVCEKYHAKLIISVIPNAQADLTEDFMEDRKTYVLKQYPNAFKGVEQYLVVLPVTANDYTPIPDAHLNDKGHEIAYQFLLQQLNGINTK